MVAFERWLLTRGFISDLTLKILGFEKLVAEERWSKPEVQLYLLNYDKKNKSNYGINMLYK